MFCTLWCAHMHSLPAVAVWLLKRCKHWNRSYICFGEGSSLPAVSSAPTYLPGIMSRCRHGALKQFGCTIRHELCVSFPHQTCRYKYKHLKIAMNITGGILQSQQGSTAPNTKLLVDANGLMKIHHMMKAASAPVRQKRNSTTEYVMWPGW